MGCVVECSWYSHNHIFIYSSLQNGEYSLMVASKNGHVEVVWMLLSAGVKPDPQQVSSSSPAQGYGVTWEWEVQNFSIGE